MKTRIYYQVMVYNDKGQFVMHNPLLPGELHLISKLLQDFHEVRVQRIETTEDHWKTLFG